MKDSEDHACELDPYLDPPKARLRWRRLHSGLLMAVVLNTCLLVLFAWFSRAFADNTVYEVNLVNVMKSDGELKLSPNDGTPPRHTDVAPAPRTAHRPNVAGNPAPAPAPGHNRRNLTAKAPPPLKVRAPQIVDVPTRQVDSLATVVSANPPPPDASLKGNPAGVSGGDGTLDSEGPGGEGRGGMGSGGNGPGGPGGPGAGNPFGEGVNLVRCIGCHAEGSGVIRSPEPAEVERWFGSLHWRPGGTPHPLVLVATIGTQGEVRDVRVKLSCGSDSVDRSAMTIVQGSRWFPARLRADGSPVEVTVEFPMEVFY